ncbi:DUF2612 domain-containing protein [uncultured Fibrobacter sp.]|uniref:DUF2612 domain-containing protein n=1 Tax=uncultured Fibrobacter sp. TaxID=261512 RepID=UPI0025F0A256|nr:DUF2612 domain-containing protein [uncultured Fibrobacter sp.]
MSEPITDYSSEQRKYVPEQYKRSTKLLGVIDASLGFSDELEKALRKISDNFNIEDAVGPMLDYLGLYFGIERRIGETDEQLRMRIRIGSGTEDLPTNEAIYNYFKVALGISDMVLCPVWPAGLYFVLGHGMPEPDIDEVRTISAASGVDFGQGTFLSCEDGELWGLIVLEDNGQPIVIDQRWPDTEYELVDDDGNYLVDSEGNHLVALDFLTTT